MLFLDISHMGYRSFPIFIFWHSLCVGFKGTQSPQALKANPDSTTFYRVSKSCRNHWNRHRRTITTNRGNSEQDLASENCSLKLCTWSSCPDRGTCRSWVILGQTPRSTWDSRRWITGNASRERQEKTQEQAGRACTPRGTRESRGEEEVRGGRVSDAAHSESISTRRTEPGARTARQRSLSWSNVVTPSTGLSCCWQLQGWACCRWRPSTACTPRWFCLRGRCKGHSPTAATDGISG